MSAERERRPVAVGRRAVAVAALLGAATVVAVLPLCNLLFGCGCDWPWSGGIDHCNIYRAGERHCPWCMHPWTANVSLAAILAAQAFGAWSLARTRGGFVAPILGGACGGAAAAVAARGLVAWWAGYPLSVAG